jgi:hypothetical protein
MFGDHGIIYDPTMLVEEYGERRGVGCECRERRRREPFKKGGRSWATETRFESRITTRFSVSAVGYTIRNTALAYFD